MIVDTAPLGRQGRRLAVVTALPARVVLGGMVALSALCRFAAAGAHGSPRLLPDEYIYFTLARSLAHGSTAIRGHAAHFPALVEPLLASPLWILGGNDPERVYRLTQGLHAVVVSLVAVPVYLLARRVGTSERTGLVCAAVALALPALLFTAFITADAVGLTLAVSAVAAGVAALERPSWRSQALFLGLTAAATLTRIQYVVLAVAFVAAALVLQRGRIVRALSAYRVTGGVAVLAVVGVLGAGPARALGYYRGVESLGFHPGSLLHWLATDTMLLAYAAGWVLVPVALVGLVLGISRPRSAAELAFSSFVGSLVVLLLLEAAVYASNAPDGSGRFQERYLIALLPLVPVLFACGAQRLESRARIGAVAVSIGLFLVATLVPLSGYTTMNGTQDSPTLLAVYQLERSIGYGDGSLAVAIAAAVLMVVSAVGTLRPRLGVPVLFVLALAVLVVASKTATDIDARMSSAAQRTYTGRKLIDAPGLGKISILELPYASRTQISTQLFWNPSLTRILRMKRSDQVDAFGDLPVTVGDDGTIFAAGRPVTGTLLVEEYASSARLEGARLVKKSLTSSLWRPEGTPRLATLTAGRYLDGWFGAFGAITVWPHTDAPRRGLLRLKLSIPAGVPQQTLELQAPGVRRTVRVTPAGPVVVELPALVRKPWRVHFFTKTPLLAPGGRLVSVRGDIPQFVETP